jgi:hypothetical protein
VVSPCVELTKVRAAVERFDALYGESERALWCLSRHCRTPLLEGRNAPEVEALVWTIKSWWGVQGVATATKPAIAAALASVKWSAELFEPTVRVPALAATRASDLAAEVVARSQELGAARREYSLISKALHWLLPWRIPVYDSFVRKSMGVPLDWDHPRAYAQLALHLFAEVRGLDEAESTWMGSIEPASPLRALDKYFWWIGGGDKAHAALVTDPWRPIDALGLPRT